MDKSLTRTQRGRGIDWNHHGPLQNLRTLNADEFDGLPVGVDPSFATIPAQTPVSVEVANRALQALDATRSRPLEHGFDIGACARAAITFAGAQDRSYRKPFSSFRQEKRKVRKNGVELATRSLEKVRSDFVQSPIGCSVITGLPGNHSGHLVTRPHASNPADVRVPACRKPGRRSRDWSPH